MEKTLFVGHKASLKKTFTEHDVLMFAQLSLDSNPLHLQEDFAETTVFKKRIVHGFLYSSLISAVLGTKLPGPGTVYMSQSLQFIKPVFLGEEVTAEVEVREINREKGKLILATNCYKNNNELVVKGEALVKLF